MNESTEAWLTIDGHVAALHLLRAADAVREVVRGLPNWSRTWDRDRAVWLVAPEVVSVLAERLRPLLAAPLAVPPRAAYAPPSPLMVSLRYIGALNGVDALGAARALGEDGHNYILWGPALLAHYGVAPDSIATHYGTLGVAEDAPPAAIAAAYRQALREWHPDVCREPDAHTRTIQIMSAYEVLHDPQRRAAYDATLAERRRTAHWRHPRRSGILFGRGYALGYRTIVTHIDSWEPMRDADGRVLVASRWSEGGPITERWVEG